jgi:hypothetical protein
MNTDVTASSLWFAGKDMLLTGAFIAAVTLSEHRTLFTAEAVAA